jgi:hypothetical protein
MQDTDLKLYKSLVITDTSINGDRVGYSEVADNVLNNLFPNVSAEERAAGGSRLRKAFFRNVNASLETLSNARVMIQHPSSAADFFVLIAGGQRDTQGDLAGTEKQHAAGVLNAQANAGGTQVVVDFDDASEVDLADTDILWIAAVTWDSGNGKWTVTASEFNTVSGTPSWVGNQATIDLGSQLQNTYAAGSVCAMVIDLSDIKASAESWTETSAAGTYDEASNPLEFDAMGTVDDDFTLEFSDATNFTVTGLKEGNIGSGDISTDFAPTNPNTSTPYFTLRAAGWGGTWAASDTITFTTHPAAAGIWIKEIWAAGAAIGSNMVPIRLYGE